MSDDESESDILSVVLNESVEEDIPLPADEDDLADDESNQPTAEVRHYDWFDTDIFNYQQPGLVYGVYCHFQQYFTSCNGKGSNSQL